MIKFDADKFYAAMLAAASNDETRSSLTGVCIQPHPAKGIILIATDGAVLVAIHDETGMFMPEDGATEKIVRLSPTALRTCKPVKNRNRPGIMGRQIRIEGTTATVYDVTDDGTAVQAVAISERCLIDGTFPNWRRVVPQPGSVSDRKGHATFNIEPLAILTKVAKALAGDAKQRVGLRIASAGLSSPAFFVEFFPSVSAFGVIMPLKGNDTAPAWPAWFAEPQASTVAA